MAQQAEAGDFRCLRCDRPIPATVRRCPYCREPTPGGKARLGATAALWIGVPLAIGFFGVGWFINNGSFNWLIALHPIDKIACNSTQAEAETIKAFNDGPGKVRFLKLVGMDAIKQVSRTHDELRCNATGRFDDGVARPVVYRFFSQYQQISLEVRVP